MFRSNVKKFQLGVLMSALLLLISILPATAGLSDLLGKKELDDTERQETIERIDSIQEKLKLLQDKLRALERRKAAKETALKATGSIPVVPVQINWQPVDAETTDPGEFGLYTYLLFKGEMSDNAAVGILEDFILTIETLPENEIPTSLGNRFLVPVEKPQSMVSLGRQPYDFKLNKVYLDRLQLQDNLPDGPVLVSMRQSLDPFSQDALPAFLAVSVGRQNPQRALELAKIWHRQEKDAITVKDHPVSALFWEVIDGAGPTRVVRDQQRTLVALPQQ